MKTAFMICLAVLSSWTSASAAAILLEISGEVYSVDSALTPYYSVFAPFNVNLLYDSAGPYGATVEMTTSGHDLFGSGGILIQNNAPYDEFIFGEAPMSGFDIAPYDRPRLLFDFIDESSSLFSDRSLPNPFPQLSQWTHVVAHLGYEDHAANMSRRLELRVDAVNVVTEVPELSSTLLLGISCTLFLLRRRRNE